MKPNHSNGIVVACDLLGSQAALAVELGVSYQAVNGWVRGSRSIPPKRCIEIERLTSGRVRCETMRPDIDWSYLRNTRKSQ